MSLEIYTPKEHCVDYRTGAVAPSIACPPHMQTNPKLTLVFGTLFRGNLLCLPLFQEEQVVSYWQMNGRMNGHSMLVVCVWQACPGTVNNWPSRHDPRC